MTLILTTLRPKDVLITSDSRSTIRKKGEPVTFNDTFQKLFPIPDHPVVIFNHGENDLNGQHLPTFINDFVKNLNTGNYTIEEIGDQLRAYAHPHIRKRLKSLDASIENRACGFCVVGFGTQPKEPRMVEIFWKLVPSSTKGKDFTAESLTTEEHQWPPVSVIPCGLGVKQIDKVAWQQVADKPIEEVEKYHATLMQEAMTAKIEPNTVGGPIHELIITREGWAWTHRPPKPAP